MTVFLRFHAVEDGSEWVFAGTRDAIMVDTKGGTAFAFVHFSSCTEMTDDEVRCIGFRYYPDAIKATAEGDGSYLIGILNRDGYPSEWRLENRLKKADG